MIIMKALIFLSSYWGWELRPLQFTIRIFPSSNDSCSFKNILLTWSFSLFGRTIIFHKWNFLKLYTDKYNLLGLRELNFHTLIWLVYIYKHWKCTIHFILQSHINQPPSPFLNVSLCLLFINKLKHNLTWVNLNLIS